MEEDLFEEYLSDDVVIEVCVKNNIDECVNNDKPRRNRKVK